ncbi:Glucoamylase (glucan-1,4-alpha-glucosidase), GH15 family [Modestobacter sp. DSM 44400]|uniref:glycoside hydrolase family 15 protein n=1 Tax=Modestobacter sp. DSM 44400 TaxID=1550230 RepID=UPI000894C970|nr:glycoside hydrolase family 15 protein [Modestobacter sp. DSM 44400]SDX99101.1 Glucoamylase (glucan-1,4-alpha-glucosidase), GH15 family [Modestobacter sp. DSM 44400]
MSDLPIGEYGFLSDCHSAALVSRAGSVDWLCFPRFDSPSVFARLLDDAAGHWSITAAAATGIQRAYLPDSLVLRTEFTTATGILTLTDALALGADNRGHEIGAGAPHLLLRVAECVAGEVDVDVEYVPRPEYGVGRPLLERDINGEGTTLTTRGGPDRLVLTSTHPLDVDGASASGRVRLRAGQSLAGALSWSRSWQPPPAPCAAEEIRGRLQDTLTGWRSWSAEHQRFDGPWAEEVRLAGIVLQGLTFQPTGAIVAAPTTSLPEAPGAGRNWDYRYGWIRDASLTLRALWVAACPDEASTFLDWLVGAAFTDLQAGRPLQIMYGVAGEHDLTERELPYLSGWHGNRPVRIGNDAWSQHQLDVYGELLDAVHTLADQIGELDKVQRRFLIGVADAAAAAWLQPDQGIWELRGAPQHHLYSKLMCWVAMDRAIDLAGLLQARDRVEDWTATREAIAATILTDGFHEEVGAFTQAFGSTVIDASALMVPIVGLLPGDDPRVLGTIKAVKDRLCDERGFVRRYEDGSDGFAGTEGAFVLCTFWLAHALALTGQVDEAKEVFATALTAGNDLGLMAEEVDPRTGHMLGNFPQAFSHVGLVTAAYAIAELADGSAGVHRRPPSTR